MELKTTLAAILKKKGWSLTKLAKEASVPVSTLHSWIAGDKKTLNLEQLKAVSLVLEVPIHSLAFGCGDPFDAPDEDETLKELFSGDVRVTVHRILKKRKNGNDSGAK